MKPALFPAPALLVAEQSHAAEDVAMLGASQLIEFALALGAVIAFIYVLAWMLRRLQNGAQGQGHLRILQGLQVGAKEKLLLVQVQDQVLLVGVSSGGLQTLHTLEEPLSETSTSTAPVMT